MLGGRELLVLSIVPGSAQMDQYGNVHDAEIARETRLPLPDVKAVLECLDREGLVSKVRLTTGQYDGSDHAQGHRLN